MPFNFYLRSPRVLGGEVSVAILVAALRAVKLRGETKACVTTTMSAK
jgi:hypothetical protein